MKHLPSFWVFGLSLCPLCLCGSFLLTSWDFLLPSSFFLLDWHKKEGVKDSLSKRQKCYNDLGLMLVCQTHTASCFGTEINTNAQKVSGASCFTPLASYTVLRARGRGNLSSFTAIPGHHLQNIQRASTNTLGATDAGIVDFD